MSLECFVLAIDGPAGVGKSSTAREVANRLDLVYLDTGGIYRCVGLTALRAGADLGDDAAMGALASAMSLKIKDNGRQFLLDGEDVSGAIRAVEVSDAASMASALPRVREALMEQQRRAAQPPGVVVEGRDIGTVIFPEADLKIFLTADPVVRATRRALQMGLEEGSAEMRELVESMAGRDLRDSTRDTAPLRPAEDAVPLDSSSLGFEGVVERILAEVNRVKSTY